MSKDERTGGFDSVKGFSLEEEEAILARRAHKAKLRNRKSRSDIGTKGSLNINSMMDLMVIILVFLIMSNNDQKVKPEMSDELFMPWSTTTGEIDDTLTITISIDSVLVNDDYVVNVRDGDFLESDKISATSPIIPDLQTAVEQILQVEEQWSAGGLRAATIIADHETSYQVLTCVMMTASAAGIQEFKFAVLQRTQGSPITEG